MFETCMNDIYDFIDNILIFFNLIKEEKNNFIDENMVNNYRINRIYNSV